MPSSIGSPHAHSPQLGLRQNLRWAYAQAALWAIGNALTSGTLLIYLALDLGARGLAISLILAAPAVSGLLRLAAPWIIHGFGGVKPACLTMFGASYVLLLGQPVMAFPEWLPWENTVFLLVSLVCVHQLLEYLGQVALWTWLGGLVPGRIRGRFFAVRQMVQLVCVIPTLLASGSFADWWKRLPEETTQGRMLLAYAIPAAAGVILLLASLLPLLRLPSPRHDVSPAKNDNLRRFPLRAAFRDRRFRQFLVFGCWFSLANGISQSAQNIYPKEVLGYGVFHLALFRTTMRIGQIGYSPLAGGLVDRFGNRPVLVLSQAIVSLGPFFFWLSTPSQPWWLWGAWLAWSAFAGINICLPNLNLTLAEPDDRPAYLALYQGITAVVYAASTVIGGILINQVWERGIFPTASSSSTAPFAIFFLAGWYLRTGTVWWASRIEEPRASTLRRMIRQTLHSSSYQ